MNEIDILRKLINASNSNCLSTKCLDHILEEAWGDKYNAGMHCNSMMRRGIIDYIGDDDWEILVTKEDLDSEEQSRKEES